MLVPKSMVNLSDLFGTQKERPKSTRPEKQAPVPHGKRFNPEQFLSSQQVEELREMRECSFQPALTRSKSRASNDDAPAPKGFDTIVQRLRVGHELQKRKREEMENVGRPKIDVRELLDEDGKTKIQPFNFLTKNRPERLKDKREGQVRASIDATASGSGFGLKSI